MEFVTLAIGEKFDKNIKSYPEGLRIDLDDMGFETVISFSNISKSEKDAVQTGAFQCGFIVKNRILFILLKFGTMNWMDAAFHIQLSPRETELNHMEEGIGMAFKAFLVDSKTGILEALRLVGLPTKFTNDVVDIINEQYKEDFNREDYNMRASSVYKYFSTNELVRLAKKNGDIYNLDDYK